MSTKKFPVAAFIFLSIFFSPARSGLLDNFQGKLPPERIDGLSYQEIRGIANYHCSDEILIDPYFKYSISCAISPSINACEQLSHNLNAAKKGSWQNLTRECSRQIAKAQKRIADIEKGIAEREERLTRERGKIISQDKHREELISSSEAGMITTSIKDMPVAYAEGAIFQFTMKELLACLEKRRDDDGYRINQDGRNLRISIKSVYFSSGNHDVRFHFIENPDYWYLREIKKSDISLSTPDEIFQGAPYFLLSGCN